MWKLGNMDDNNERVLRRHLADSVCQLRMTLSHVGSYWAISALSFTLGFDYMFNQCRHAFSNCCFIPI